jgi:hypothetical protein
MDRDVFLRFVEAHHWRTAKSSPHQYTIKTWADDKGYFEEAVRFAFENGSVGYFNNEWFSYYRPGDGYRYWSYWNGELVDHPKDGLKAMIAFNRARESGQMRLWAQEEWAAKAERLTWSDGDVSIKRK